MSNTGERINAALASHGVQLNDKEVKAVLSAIAPKKKATEPAQAAKKKGK